MDAVESLVPRTYSDLLSLAEAAEAADQHQWEAWQAGMANAYESTPEAIATWWEITRAGGTVPEVAAPERNDVAQKAMANEVCQAIQLDVLGREADGTVVIFSLFHRQTTRIRQVDRLSYEQLILYCGPPALEHIVMSRVDDIPGMYSVGQVRQAISLLGGYKRLGEEWGCGPGVWQGLDLSSNPTSYAILVNASDAAKYAPDNELLRIVHPRDGARLLDISTGGNPWYDFDELSANLKLADSLTWRQSIESECLELFGRWNWVKNRETPQLLVGLIIATWVQTLWAWRPQVVILGETNSGKSMLVTALQEIFHGLCFNSSDTTAAGMLQAIQHSSRATLLDEFDAKEKEDRSTRQQILSMLRASSRGNSIHRGTSHGKSREMTIKILPWILGKDTSHSQQADENRMVLIELKLPEPDKVGQLVLPAISTLRSLGQRLLAAALWCSRHAVPLAASLRTLRLAGIDSRAVESYAVPTAVLAVMRGLDGDLEACKAILPELLSEKIKQTEESGGGTKDEEKLLDLILLSQLRIEHSTASYSVAQLLHMVFNSATSTGASSAEQSLANAGLKLSWSANDGTGQRVVVFQHGTILTRLLFGSRYSSGTTIRNSLLRIQGSFLHPQLNVGRLKKPCVCIPWSVLERNYIESENQNPEF